MSKLADLPGPVKVVAMLVCGSGLAGLFNSLRDSGPVILMIVLALLAAGAIYFLFRWFLKWREKGKSLPFMGKIMRAAGGTPQGVAADPAKRARLDDLRKKFEEGVQKFRANGKDVYGLPWYLLVGPSGSGKTEAIRHCNVGFPPGLQDYLQGAGGTLNMNWWFTNHAVILDTAGKMFMEEVAAGENSEWEEFLKILRDSRVRQPINGMVLCIGVDSLIKDSADKIGEEAGKIARKLDMIQRKLDVRFPVFVLVTKCDLITGFREYFEKYSGPGVQDQMLGWSNPAGLDEPFQPDRVGEHIDTVRERLIRRRFTHLVDPIHTEDPQARRTDQVDSLFALPDSLQRLSSRLRRYLELIFVAGEWSPKPLFLRGIYFTSSMRQGAELDEEVAKILGMPVDSLPGGGMTEEKSYFLRDVFTSKVFKERGLVTRATNVTKQQRTQKLALVGSGIAAALVLGVFTVISGIGLSNSIAEGSKSWESLAAARLSTATPMTFVIPDRSPAEFNDEAKVELSGEKVGIAGAVQKSLALAQRPPTVPLVLKVPDLMGWVGRDGTLAQKLKDAHEALVFDTVVAPVVNSARQKLKDPKLANPWLAGDENAATGVLACLLAIERGEAPPEAAPTTGAGSPAFKVERPIDMNKFCGFLFPAQWEAESKEPEPKIRTAAEKIQGVLRDTYSSGGGTDAWANWPPKVGNRTLAADPEAVKRAVASFTEYWKSEEPVNRRLKELGTLEVRLREFLSAEEALASSAKNYEVYEQSSGHDVERYEKFHSEWLAKYGELQRSWTSIKVLLEKEKVKVADLDKRIEDTRLEITAQAKESFRVVMGIAPDSPLLVEARKQAEQKVQLTPAMQLLLNEAEKESKKWSDDLEPLRQDLDKTRKPLLAGGGTIDTRLSTLKAFFNEKGDGGKLLAKIGGGSDKTVCQVRFEAYELATKALALSANDVKGDKIAQIGNLADAGASLEADIKAKDDEVVARASSLADSRLKVEKASGFGAVFEAARRNARFRVIEAALKAETTTSSTLSQNIIKRLEEPLATSGAITRKIRGAKGVPLLSDEATEVRPEFNPDAAELYFKDIAYLLQQYPADPKLARALTSNDYLTAARDTSANAREYAQAYVKYWGSDLVNTRVAIQPAAGWPTLKSGLTELIRQRDDAAAKLRDLGEGAAMALSIKGLAEALGEAEGKGGSKEGSDRQNWANKLGNAGKDAGDTIKKYMQPWSELSDQSVTAVNTLGELSKSDFDTDYLRGFTCASDPAPSTPFAKYMDSLRLKALEQIAIEVESQRKANAPTQVAPLLFEPREAGHWEDSLSRERLQQVKQFNFPAAGNTGGDGTLIKSWKTVSQDCVKKQLQRMFSPPDALNEKVSAKLRAWMPFLLEGADGKELKFQISYPSAAQLKAMNLRTLAGLESAHDKLLCTEVTLSAKTTQANEVDVDQPLTDWTQLPLRGPERLKITFKKGCENGQPVDGTRDLSSPWAVLELLAEPESYALDTPGDELGASKAWAVPVKFKQGAAWKYKWLRIEFNTKVPAKREWPTAQAWAER